MAAGLLEAQGEVDNVLFCGCFGQIDMAKSVIRSVSLEGNCELVGGVCFRRLRLLKFALPKSQVRDCPGEA